MKLPSIDVHKSPLPLFFKEGEYNRTAECGLCLWEISPFGKGGLRGICFYGSKDLFGYGFEFQQDLPIVEAQYSYANLVEVRRAVFVVFDLFRLEVL